MRDYSALIADRLRRYFDAAPHGAKTDFCKATGIHPQNLKNWLAGRKIPLDEVDPIARGLGYPGAWELLRPESSDLPPTALEIVRILGRLNEDQLRALLGTAKLFAHVNGIEQGGSLTQKQKSGG